MAAFYRIVQAHWVHQAMTGEGAYRYGGRWNLPGDYAIYLAESRALAALEIIVHAPRETLQLDWRVIGVEIPDELIEEKPLKKLPRDWRALPSSNAAQRFGSAWLSSASSLALRLPSTIIPQESCVMINPLKARDMMKMTIGKPEVFRFDERL